jgi:hypothetical protein
MQQCTLPITSIKLYLNSFPYFTASETTAYSIPLRVQHIGRAHTTCHLWKSSLAEKPSKLPAEMSMCFLLARV